LNRKNQKNNSTRFSIVFLGGKKIMPSSLVTTLCLVGGIILVVIIFIANAIRIVPEYMRLVVFRLGRCVGDRGPGVVFLIPIVDRAVKVDLREQVREIPHQTSITKDNAPISIDFLWYYKVLSATESVLQVGNFETAAQGMATTTLRSVIGAMSLDEVLSERDHINQMLREKLDEVTERWGVKVTNVEIREIIPPREVQDAMNRQMSAERIRRAVVTESTGTREAAINVAGGEKQAAILRAEGEKQGNILRAEGERQAQLLRAEGFANALTKIFESAQAVDPKTMTLQYFETLKSIGASPSTKYIFPMEFTSMLENFIKERKA
jgi:regulator of protease activity HflC (stomatin/prohibitin superfamily)